MAVSAACQTTSTFDFDNNLIQTQGGKGGLSGGIDCMKFIYGAGTRDMAVCVAALMAIRTAFSIELRH